MLFLELNDRSLHFTDIIIMGTETACTPAAQDQPDTGTAGAGHPSGSGAGVIVIGSSSRWRDLGDFGAVARTGDRAAVVVVCVAGSGDSAFCRGGLQKAKASHSSENDTWQWPTGAAPCPDVAPERVSHRGGALGGSAGLLRQRFELPCGDLASFEAEQGRGEPLPPVDNHALGRAEVRRLAPDARRAPLRDNRGRRPW